MAAAAYGDRQEPQAPDRLRTEYGLVEIEQIFRTRGIVVYPPRPQRVPEFLINFGDGLVLEQIGEVRGRVGKAPVCKAPPNGAKPCVGIARSKQHIAEAVDVPEALGAEAVHFAQRVGVGRQCQHQRARRRPVTKFPGFAHRDCAAQHDEGGKPETSGERLIHDPPSIEGIAAVANQSFETLTRR